MAKRNEPEVLPNGAILFYVPHPWDRWSITSSDGAYQGLRPTYEAARAFALTLPGTPQVPPPEPTLSRSKRATTGYWGEPGPGRVPMGLPREELADFNFSAPPLGAPAQQRRDPMAESKEKSRRQALAHDGVYGRHRR